MTRYAQARYRSVSHVVQTAYYAVVIASIAVSAIVFVGCEAALRIEDISDLVGHSSTSVTETVYRPEIRPALTKGATAMNRILKAQAERAG